MIDVCNRSVKCTPVVYISCTTNEQQRHASASIQCKDPLLSDTPCAEELENNIELLIHDQDLRQHHFPGKQNNAENGDEEEAYSRDEEGQHVFQSLSPD